MSTATPEQCDYFSGPGTPSGLMIPQIMLPHPTIDLYHWSVIACDQHTASLEYWQETASITSAFPSAYHLILPEYYLEHPDDIPLSKRIQSINQTMAGYLEAGLLRQLDPGCILVDRATPDHPRRLGLLLAIDLECYDFTPGSRQLVRATEGTVVSRIPPRAAVRRDAPLELPHVQLLIDDPQQTVIEPLYEQVQKTGTEPIYDTLLMQQGGSVKGWFFPEGAPQLNKALQALNRLDSLLRHGLLMAVGDGNHSLATAREHWLALRNHVPADHPARYALVEVLNLHDAGLNFEPIHRVLSGLSAEALMNAAHRWFGSHPEHLDQQSSAAETTEVLLPMLSRCHEGQLPLPVPAGKLPVAVLQPFLDHLADREQVQIDYIHGIDEVKRLADAGFIGLLLPAMSKHDLFPCIVRDGILPRKTFSMGEAYEKRYYLECRRIR